MFWSKLWLGIVTLVAGLAIAVALLAPRPLQRDVEHEAGARLERAQHAASLLLKVNARKWMDTAAQVATDAVLVESLEQATRGPADLGLVHKTVKERLRYFNDRMKVDLVIATDGKGRVIARAGLDEGVYKDGVEGFPLVADALRGLRGDDTWSVDGKLYRVAGSPVIARDRYAGALIVGQEVGKELAQSMKQVLDVDVAFLLRGRVLAASSQLPVLGRLPALIDQQAAAVAKVGHSAPLAVDAGDRAYLVVLAPFAGEAAGHKASYVLILSRPGAATIGALVAELAAWDRSQLPWETLWPVGAALVLALVLGLLLMRLEADRPLKRMARDAQALARGEVQRLDDDRHPGKLGAVARAVNTTLDRLGTSPASRPASLRPPSERPAVSPSAFAPTQSAPLASPVSAPAGGLFNEPPEAGPATPPPIPRFSAEPRPAPPPPPPPTPSLELRDPRASTVETTAYADDSTHSRTSQKPTLLGSPPLERLSMAGDTDAQVTQVATHPGNDGPDMIDAPGQTMPSLAEAASAAAAVRRIMTPRPARAPDFSDDQPTIEAHAAPAVRHDSERHATPEPSPEERAIESELEQVYQDFIETKQRLGEPTEGVTYDKFLLKLKANRAQLITRYACKTVKFQVYVKDGKAALKATPVQA